MKYWPVKCAPFSDYEQQCNSDRVPTYPCLFLTPRFPTSSCLPCLQCHSGHAFL